MTNPEIKLDNNLLFYDFDDHASPISDNNLLGDSTFKSIIPEGTLLDDWAYNIQTLLELITSTQQEILAKITACEQALIEFPEAHQLYLDTLKNNELLDFDSINVHEWLYDNKHKKT